MGTCQLEVWSHMFLESLTLEFVSIWAPLTFSIGKLQKLALSVWAWNFVSFFSIFCSNHSGTLFSLGVSACSWRTSVLSLASWWSWWGKRPTGFIILALSAGAADTNSTGIAGYSQNTSWKHVGYHEKNLHHGHHHDGHGPGPWRKETAQDYDGPGEFTRWDRHHFHHAICSPILATKKVRENACFATRATCKTGLLADAFMIDKVCR